MKKFDFKLQKLLDIRKAEEDGVKNELARLLNIQNLERLKQEEYRRKIGEQQALFDRKMKQGKFTYMEASLFERFVDFAHKVIAAAQDRIESMEPEIRKVRVRLIEASRKRKVVDKLKERKWQAYLYELNRETGKENDDMNQKVFIRRRIEKALAGA
jgi:flagellar FliJ protein